MRPTSYTPPYHDILCPACGSRSCPFTRTLRKRTVSRCRGKEVK